jgi:hypothetical protein
MIGRALIITPFFVAPYWILGTGMFLDENLMLDHN